MESMKEQTFGIEVETTGLGRERTAKAIAAYIGMTARYIGRHLDDWQMPMPDGRPWTVERDGSVTDPSAEVVSSVCAAKAVFGRSSVLVDKHDSRHGSVHPICWPALRRSRSSLSGNVPASCFVRGMPRSP